MEKLVTKTYSFKEEVTATKKALIVLGNRLAELEAKWEAKTKARIEAEVGTRLADLLTKK